MGHTALAAADHERTPAQSWQDLVEKGVAVFQYPSAPGAPAPMLRGRPTLYSSR